MSRKTEDGLQMFGGMIKNHYGSRVFGLYRVDLDNDYEDQDRADAYIAVVLADKTWNTFDEIGVLAGLAYDALELSDVYMRALPISKSDWDDPKSLRTEISADARAKALPLTETLVV